VSHWLSARSAKPNQP